MAHYRQERKTTGRASTWIGAVLTVACHGAVLVFGAFTGLKYLDPPPQEQTFLIDFTEQPKPIEQRFDGTEPTQEEIDRTKPLELAQRSEAPVQGKKANQAEEAVVDDKGDVEVPQPPKEKEIDKRALFRSANNDAAKDTLAPQTANEPSDKLKPGHASGNTQTGSEAGEPNARVKGRSVVGVLPTPKYNVQGEGTVVVRIWVDNYGSVQRAEAGADGTTVVDSKLWAAARTAAMGAHFNVDSKASALQEGTITYIFRLK